YGFATILLVASVYLTTKTIALVGDVLDILLQDITAGTIFSSEFNWLIIRMISFILISWVSFSLNIYIWADATFRVQRDMRQEFYEVIQDHSMAFYDVSDSGVILSMGMNEINQIRMAVHPGFRMLLSSMLSIIITTVLLMQYDWIVGVVLAVSFVIYLIIAWRYAARVGPIRQKLATDLGDLSAISQEMFRGVEVVRAFDNHDKEIDKFNGKSLEYAEDMKREGYLSAFYWPALITIVVTAGAFAYGLWMVTSQTGTSFTIGALISILGLLISLNRQNFMIPQRLIFLQAGLENSERLWNMMAFEDPLQQPEQPEEGDWEQDIHFKNVNFAYPGTEKMVLKDISFTIPTGSKVALIGGPGSGKSTILKLLLRLYDPSEGSIEVDGTSLESMHTNYVRSNVTMVEQDIFLFSDTLRSNIAFAKPEASDEEIRSAAEKAQIAQFIESLPDKYDTVIGERGVTLSGGQRQRIAIARALLSDPKLLLLDDSTSAVDIKTELRLRYAMEELMKERTSIVVTQRLTTLVAADIIILMKRGKIVDIGSHDELLQRCTDYQFMCQHLPMAESMGVCRDIDVAEGGSK
ncbi:MAG: ABC transporter ATP-binding protein, partial [Candidatus Heimdallarchaeota archaeon]|nr:ABC transporter ATP-binding protein [Candidatus Heimdallarchaeota archaeon]MCK4877441.1 ABC transporter ATP-binding protein [Candidatus Heimdallarchaeota archaeon]